MSATIETEAEILTRVIGPENPTYTPETARSILQMRFADPDIHRMNELAAKAHQGSLTDSEEKQLHGYLFVGAMLDLMQSKARISLKKAGD